MWSVSKLSPTKQLAVFVSHRLSLCGLRLFSVHLLTSISTNLSSIATADLLFLTLLLHAAHTTCIVIMCELLKMYVSIFRAASHELSPCGDDSTSLSQSPFKWNLPLNIPREIFLEVIWHKLASPVQGWPQHLCFCPCCSLTARSSPQGVKVLFSWGFMSGEVCLCQVKPHFQWQLPFYLW